MDACKFSHVISLQSMTLFVRLINHHCGKALMFMLFFMKGKGGKKLFSTGTTVLYGAAVKGQDWKQVLMDHTSPPEATELVQG